ncbi:hypothetical protein [Alkalihalobacillus sp. LMS39]|uniref:hypothetical protein n=1 Tax=Alkalihalobacillus sp. LMS39 TaxID=2924032 RepID=UPI001FB39299|nr:hypothetical protein [Alkalihalobacillus sp. LMS39]UOE92057.1 hypothetical protein MM271_12340 [Alkalihalobacillus sp. LMS39]
MFDPTIYENLKVVLEGELYDLDLQGTIEIVNRKDLIDMATMSRIFSIEWKRTDQQTLYPTAELVMTANLEDFALEKIDHDVHRSGCDIRVHLIHYIANEEQCYTIKQKINTIWNNRPLITQKVYYDIGAKEKNQLCQTTLSFNRKINEENIKDLNGIISFTVHSLER